MSRLLSLRWDEYLNYQDIELVWDKFKKKFQEAINDCIPKKEFVSQKWLRKRTNRDLPMKKKLWSKIKKKQRFWMRLKRMNTAGENNTREYSLVDEQYRQINNQIRRDTRTTIKKQ